MLYDVPGRTGTTIALETYAEAIKWSLGRRRQGRRRRLRARGEADADGLRRLLRRRRRQPRLARPRRRRRRLRRRPRRRTTSSAQMVDSFHSGDHAGALEIFTRLLPAIDAVMGVPNYGATTAKAALQLLGVIDNRNVRGPLVPLDRRRGGRAARRPRRLRTDLGARTRLESSPPRTLRAARAAEGGSAGHPARGTRRGRSQHDRLRVRRPAADRRLRRAVPRGPPPRRRPDPARLRADPGPPRRRRGAGADARPRGPHRRRRRTSCASAATSRSSGSELTLALLDSKLREHRLRETVHHKVREGDRLTLGPFELEFVAVNHSIPDALAVAIRTGAGLVLHTGDFKMDQLPLDGRITDLRAFARLGEEGVDLFLTDSTNAETPGFTPTEKSITPVIDQVFRESGQRIIVACFASHVHRVQQVLDAAVAHNRKVAYVGRSMVRNMGIARDLGYLRVPGGRDGRGQGARRAAPGAPGADLDRVAGRADERAEPDRPAQPQLRAHRGGRHRPARLQPDPRQRERRLPRHQRPLPLGRPRRAQGQRDGARQRPRERRRAALLLQHRPAPQRAAGARRDPAPARQRRARPRRPASRTSWSPRTASSST